MITRNRLACVLFLGCAVAVPSAAQAPAAPGDVLASEGIIIAPPEGFPAFAADELTGSETRRYYQSRSNGATIRVSILGPLRPLADNTAAGRKEFLQAMIRTWEAVAARTPSYTFREDSTHLIAETRANMGSGRLIVERTYLPLAGPVTMKRITVLSSDETPDATNLAIAAMLDSVRVLTDQ